MNYFIPSFEECLAITQANECFTHRYREVDGVKISMFDYLLASYPDFKRPIPGSDITAFELRGLCFTHNEDMSVHRRYILLNKFFNLNQCMDWMYADVKDKAIVKILDKLDGSVMRFIQLPNGKVVVKSKTFFDNDQTTLAMQVYNKDKALQGFVQESLDQNLAAIFELISNKNRIVVLYPKTELVLLQLRDEVTGEYLDIHSHPLVKKYGVKLVSDETESFTYFKEVIENEGTESAVKRLESVTAKGEKSLTQLLELKPVIRNKEGWIVQFHDGQMCKIKGDDYCRLHGILSESLARENLVMAMILDNTIDDALAELDANDDRKPRLEELCQKVTHYLIAQVRAAQDLAATYQGDRKEWAMKYRNEELFSIAAKVVGRQDDTAEDLLDLVKKRLKMEVNTLFAARDFIKLKLGMSLMLELSNEDGE